MHRKHEIIIMFFTLNAKPRDDVSSCRPDILDHCYSVFSFFFMTQSRISPNTPLSGPYENVCVCYIIIIFVFYLNNYSLSPLSRQVYYYILYNVYG